MSSNKPNRNKRSSPNEENNSFVQNVTSRMSLLLPASITKWFSSPMSTSSNGSAPTADSDSSTEDEAMGSSVIVQPPAKKMRYSKVANRVTFDETKNTNNTYETVDLVEPSTSFNIQSPTTYSVFQKEAKFASPAIESSSQETQNQSDKDNSKLKSHHTVSQIGGSVENERKSLFFSDTPASKIASMKACEKTSRNTIKDPNQPYFKASLLQSPFYHGPTMYGGASGSYYQNEPNIKQRKVAVVNEAENINNTISTAAKRVMELLDQYSSPLIEAKRIPQYTRNTSYSTKRYVDTPSTSQDRMKSYKTQELHVPSVASFLRLKQRNRLMDSTSTARQIMASQSSTADNPSDLTRNTNKEQDKIPSKFTSKVKSRLTRPTRGDSDYANDMVTPVVLPTGTLHIDSNNLPKFSFDTTTSKTSTAKSDLKGSLGNTIKSINTTPVDVPETEGTNRFKFSSPIKISLDLPNNTKNSSEFLFGSPDRSVEKNKTSLSCDAVSAKQICSIKSKEWKCSDCWVSNASEFDKCVCCGGKRPIARPPSSSKCTVCKFSNCLPDKEKCATCEKTQINSISNSTDTSKWKCDDCLVPNDENANKCVCCSGDKPGKFGNITANSLPKAQNKNRTKPDSKSEPVSTSSAAATIGFKFGIPSTDNSSNSQSGTNSRKSDLSSFVKAQSNKWECSSCLVRNDENKLHCTCCDAQKPGTVSEAAQKMFKFAITGITSFKFGINSVQSEPDKVKVNNTEEKTVVSETNNNDLPKTTGFSFGLPENKDTSVSPFQDLETKDLPKANFTFGIPAKPVTSATNSTSALNFPAPKESTKENNDDKEQEVPKMPELLELPKTSLVISSVSTSTPICESKTSNTTMKPPSYFTVAKKKDSQSTQIVPSATTASGSQATFTFSSGTSMKINNNLFGTATTNALPFTPEATSVTTATITSLLDTKTTTGATPFQKTETTTATASTAPLFSFGSNATSAPAQSEKPSFNFAFGSNNKAEILFKPSSSNSSNFSLGTGIVITAASAIPTVNSLTTNSTLSTNNMFLASSQKENLWSSLAKNTAAPSNVLSGALTNTPQKPAAFSFGAPSTTPAFGANATPAFGNSSVTNATPAFGCSVATNATPAFGTNAVTNAAPIFGNSSATNTSSTFGAIVTSTATPAFGSSAVATFGSPATNSTSAFGGAVGSGAPAFGSAPFGTPAQPAKPPPFGAAVPTNVFALSNQNSNNQPSLFAAPGLNNSVTPLFGTTGNNSSNPAAASGLGMFAAPSAAPTFGSSSPSFEPPAPAGFNFGTPSTPAGGMFGFGQPPQTSIYSFGGAPGNAAVQFNMGSGQVPGAHTMPMTNRKIRKARRSTTPR